MKARRLAQRTVTARDACASLDPRVAWKDTADDGEHPRAHFDPFTNPPVPARRFADVAIAGLVGNGLGTAFMPISEARRFGGLRPIKLADHVPWQVYLASPPINDLTAAAARLADALLDSAATARAL